MILIGMIHADEDALICDLAETYHVLEYRRLPLMTVAALASGLRAGARIYESLRKQEEQENNPSFETVSDFDQWRKNMIGGG